MFFIRFSGWIMGSKVFHLFGPLDLVYEPSSLNVGNKALPFYIYCGTIQMFTAQPFRTSRQTKRLQVWKRTGRRYKWNSIKISHNWSRKLSWQNRFKKWCNRPSIKGRDEKRSKNGRRHVDQRRLVEKIRMVDIEHSKSAGWSTSVNRFCSVKWTTDFTKVAKIRHLC